MSGVDFGGYKRIVRYFWDPQPTNEDLSAPMWCLGSKYTQPPPLSSSSSTQQEGSEGQSVPNSDHTSLSRDKQPRTEQHISRESTLSSSTEGLAYGSSPENPPDGGWPSAFLDDFESRIWMTYRSNFQPIAKSQDPKATASMSFTVRLRSQLLDQEGFTSDTGWGCMIRSGQSLLANAIASLKLGRDWRRGTKVEDEKKIIVSFADDPTQPFSIHRFVAYGAQACGKHPGEWFGPAATAQCIQKLSEDNFNLSGLHVYVTGDGPDVYQDKFMKIAKGNTDAVKPTLILIGIRLGIERVTPAYWEALKATLQMPQSLGIAGGRPSASHYFIGVQGSSLFYLDPHHTRPAVAAAKSLSAEDVDTYHTRRLPRMSLEEMDPSMLIGFLILDEQDWQEWKAGVKGASGKAIIHVGDFEPPAKGADREGAIDEVEAFDDEEADL